MKISSECRTELQSDLKHYGEYNDEPIHAVNCLLNTIMCDLHDVEPTPIELDILRLAYAVIEKLDERHQIEEARTA